MARSEEHATLDLKVVSSSPTLGVEVTKKKNKNKQKTLKQVVIQKIKVLSMSNLGEW